VATKIDSPFKSREQREADREAKREAVLVAAVRMFNERGFSATTFDEVAASLGVSKPTIYHYLGNKEEVLLECVSRGINELKEAAVSAAAAPGSGIDRLRAFLVRYVQVNMDDFGRCVIRTGEEVLTPEGSARFRALKKEIDTSLRGLIREAIADGSIADGDVRLIAFTIAGALNWPARWYKPGPEKERQAVAETMVSLLLGGIKDGPTALQGDQSSKER
jgi:AcrR family transcriptional regulator